MKTDVRTFLNDHRNSVIREKLVNYRFFYELKLAGARVNRDIQISFPEIDKDGYDIVLDNDETIKVFQIKTRLTDAKTPSWKIQKQLLRPMEKNLELLGFDGRPQNIGYQGGFILIDVEANLETILNFNYYYCDIFTLKAMECGLVPNKNKTQMKSAAKVIEELKSDFSYNRYEKIDIPGGVFLKARNLDSLLALANFLSTKEDFRFWHLHFESYLKQNQSEKNGTRIINLLEHLVYTKKSKKVLSDVP